MAALELEAKLAILDQAMRRLEGELHRDEYWRALHQPLADGEAGSPAAEARNTRLRLALEANPVYRAWKDVKDAADLVRGKLGADGAPAPTEPEPLSDHGAPNSETSPPSEGSDAASPTPAKAADFAAHYEWPEEIANLIRDELEQTEQREDARAVGVRAARAVDLALDIPAVEPVSEAQLVEARNRAEAAADKKPRSGGLAQRLAEAKKQEEDEPTHSVPLEAEDLAFLLSPSTSPTKASLLGKKTPSPPAPRTPFLQRLAAEEQIPRPLQDGPVGEAEVTVVRRDARKTAPAAGLSRGDAASEAANAEKARPSDLLKSWNRE
jgi:hypothetical protein